MASRPAKRQKRPIVLSSDDEDIPASQAQQTAVIANGNSLGLRWSSTKDTSTSTQILPVRHRPKTRSATLKSRLPTSTPTSPTTSSKKPQPRGAQAPKAGTSRPLQTFFKPKAHTPGSQDAPRLEAKPTEARIEEEDLIEDDSFDEGFLKLVASQTSARSVLDRRKPHLPHTQSYVTSTPFENVSSSSQKFIIPESVLPKKITKHAEVKADHTELKPWTERYGPRSLEELMVHKRKVADVQKWLEKSSQIEERKVLLVLKGPAGAGKTATICTLAKAMNLDILEWKNPIGSSLMSAGYLSMSAHFEEFLGRSSRFGSLEFTNNPSIQPPDLSANKPKIDCNRRKLVVLEEFPNTFTGTSAALMSFRSSILNYLAANAPSIGTTHQRQNNVPIVCTPIVMIITETHLVEMGSSNDNLSAHRLLGPDILNNPTVDVIEFNPIAPTLLIKALDLVIQKEARQSGRRRVPSFAVLKRLSDVGDVRSAIASLEFLCLRREDGDDWGGTIAARARKASSGLTKMEKESLAMVMQREASLGIFHAVGKVVYNKRDQFIPTDLAPEPPSQPPDHLPQHARLQISQVSVNQLMDEAGTDVQTFIAALHENYVISCEGAAFTDVLNGCIDALSDSDLLCSERRGGRFTGSGIGAGGFGQANAYQGTASDSLRQAEICFHVGVRGLLFALPYPVKRRAPPAGVAGRKGGKGDAFKMFYPTSFRLSRQMEEVESLIDRWASRYSAGVATSEPLHNRPKFLGPAPSNRPPSTLSTSDTILSTPTQQGTAEPHRTGLNATKHSLVLETLPYVAHIERSRNHIGPGTRHLLGELETMTQFTGVRPPSEPGSVNDNDDDEGDADGGWRRGTAGSKPRIDFRTRGRGAGGDLASVQAEERAEKLFLSDDDIED